MSGIELMPTSEAASVAVRAHKRRNALPASTGGEHGNAHGDGHRSVAQALRGALSESTARRHAPLTCFRTSPSALCFPPHQARNHGKCVADQVVEKRDAPNSHHAPEAVMFAPIVDRKSVV